MVQTLLTTNYRKTVLLDEEEDYVFVRLGPEQRYNGVAVLVVDASGSVLLTEARRIPVGQVCLEIPRGGKELDETLAEAAVREVEEETGLRLKPHALVPLGDVLPDSGTLRSRTCLFLAKLDDSLSKYGQELVPQEGEVDRLHIIPIERVLQLVMKNKITDGFTMAALLRSRLI